MKTIFVMTRKEVYTCMNIYEWISMAALANSHAERRGVYGA